MKIITIFVLLFVFSCNVDDNNRPHIELNKLKDVLKDSSISYQIIVNGTIDSVNFYPVDTLILKSDDIYIVVRKN